MMDGKMLSRRAELRHASSETLVGLGNLYSINTTWSGDDSIQEITARRAGRRTAVHPLALPFGRMSRFSGDFPC